jgi:hypothetical protein
VIDCAVAALNLSVTGDLENFGEQLHGMRVNSLNLFISVRGGTTGRERVADDSTQPGQ